MKRNNESTGFFRKIFRRTRAGGSAKQKLIDIVPKVHNTGYVFLDINNDISDACEVIMKGENDIRMAYGYTRRLAFAACHIQGIAEKGGYEHVCSIFKALQHQTEQTIAFQEQAFSDAVEFIQSYFPLFTSVLAKNLGLIAQDYEPSQDRLSDSELIKSVLDFAFSESKKSHLLPSRRSPCLVDLVDKRASTKLGQFGNMFEDVKGAGEKLVSDPLLSSAAGYAMYLAGAGAFVGGAMKPDIVIDALGLLKLFTEGTNDPEIIREGKDQALELAKTYVHEMDAEASEEIMTSAGELVNFCVGEERRLTVSEVVDRAKQRAKARRIGEWTIPKDVVILGLNP